MIATQTAPGGAINRETVFKFTQSGDVVEASYAGGRITVGRLIGLVQDATLEFRYTQLHDDHTLHGGHSTCQLELKPDGGVRIIEHYQWADGGAGTNVIEESE